MKYLSKIVTISIINFFLIVLITAVVANLLGVLHVMIGIVVGVDLFFRNF